jgi:hypothetical protein
LHQVNPLFYLSVSAGKRGKRLTRPDRRIYGAMQHRLIPALDAYIPASQLNFP